MCVLNARNHGALQIRIKNNLGNAKKNVRELEWKIEIGSIFTKHTYSMEQFTLIRKSLVKIIFIESGFELKNWIAPSVRRFNTNQLMNDNVKLILCCKNWLVSNWSELKATKKRNDDCGEVKKPDKLLP